MENFVWVTMEDECEPGNGLTISDFCTSTNGKAKRVQVKKYRDEVMVNNLGSYLSQEDDQHA